MFTGLLSAQQYVFRAYRQSEGLKNLAVNAITTDRSGFLWLATENGVYRFLGSGFARFGAEQGIGELFIGDIVADPGGLVWAGSGENLYVWDGRRFSPAGKDRLPIPGPRHMAVEDPSHLLVVSKGRLYRLEHDAQGKTLSTAQVFSDQLMHSVPELGQLASVSVVSRGPDRTIWVGSNKRLFSLPGGAVGLSLKLGDGAVTVWGADRGIPVERWDMVVRASHGDLWAAGQNHIVFLEAGTEHFVDRSIPTSDPGNVWGHAPIIEDSDGRILASSGSGIARWNGVRWQSIGPANGLDRITYVSGMAFDAAGDLWFVSRGDGLRSWAGYSNWEGWGERQGLPSSSIWGIHALSSGRVVVGTEKGPAWIDSRDGSVTTLPSHRKWSYGQVSALGVDKEGLTWAGTFAGSILRIDPKTGSLRETSKLSGVILNAFEDSAGRQFFATGNGVYLRPSSSSTAKPQPVPEADALLGKNIEVLTGCQQPDGTLWFLGNSRLARFKAGVWSRPPISGLPAIHGSVDALSCAVDGSLWITGQQAGTWRLTATKDGLQATRLEVPVDLASVGPLAILVDHRGWVWLGSDAGLLVWNGRTWRHLTEESGLIWNDVNQGIMKEAPDGSIWVGTSGGVAHLVHPEHIFDPQLLPIAVTDIRHNGAFLIPEQELTLPWSGAPLRLQVSSPSAQNRSELLFKYQMVGFQSGWIDSQDGLAIYSILPPGSYTFSAMAHNSGLNAWSRTITVKIRILPPWWKSYWMMVLYGLMVLAMLLAIDHVRAGHHSSRSRELERLVTERTLELEASREQLRIRATYDALTGLMNRAAILLALEAEMNRSRREHKPLIVALADLDHFKRVNDTCGHLVGDEVLRQFGAALSSAIRPYDHAGRYGGEEFLIILADIPADSADRRLADLHTRISKVVVPGPKGEFSVTCSIGAVVCDPLTQPCEPVVLLDVADQAMYEAKAQGRNCIVCRDADALHTVRTGQSSSRPFPNHP